MGRRSSNSPTIKDVARRAAVSVGTVSRVLRRRPDVDRTLQRRVETAIKDLGYRPSGIRLSAPEAGRSRIIAFLLGNGAGLSSAHEHLLLGIEEYCAEHKYHLLFTRHQYAADTHPGDMNLPDVLVEQNLVGCVIAAGTNYENFIDALHGNGLRHVLLANHVVREPTRIENLNQVRYNDFGGFAEATNYLVQLGHKHIWYIGDIARPWFRNRYEGYCFAMRQHGLEAQAHTVALSDDPYENGHAAASHILDQKRPLTAIVAGSDELAFGAREALRQNGRAIPHDVSLIGFENQMRRSHAVNLTSVCVDMAEVGRQLAKMAIQKVEGDGRDLPEVVVPAMLVKRSTCRPVRSDDVMVL